MAKHISHNFKEYQIALLAELTAEKFKELYEFKFPLPPRENDDYTKDS